MKPLKTDKNTALPPHWKMAKLGEVCEVILGQSPPSNTYNSEAIGLPFFQGKKEFTELYPIAVKWCSMPIRIAEPNDILLSVRAPVGATNIANTKCCIGRGLAAIRYKPNYKYLYYYLQSITHELDLQGTGSTFKAISGIIVRSFKYPIPPLPEQHRIVAKIEELFSELDNGIASLKKAKAQLKVYRQSVLKWAFEGRLTNGSVSDGNLPVGWQTTHVGDTIEKPKYGTSKKCSYTKKGLGVLRIPNVVGGAINPGDLKYAEFSEDERNEYRILDGDLLIIRSNGSVNLVGKCALVREVDEDFLYAGYLIRLRPIQTILSSKYLLCCLSSLAVRSQIEMLAKSTSGVNNINAQEIKSLVIPITDLPEQIQVVQEIESRLSVADKLEETIDQSLKQSEALRQSILKRAFEGKLVPQEETDR